MSHRKLHLITWMVLLTAGSTRADDIATKIAAAKGPYDGAEYIVVFHANDITVADTGIGANHCTRVIKVLTDAGIKSQSVQRWDFDPATNTLELGAVKIHRGGGPIEALDVKQAATQPESAWGIFWGSQQIVFSIPGLKIGDAVEMHWIKTGFNTAYLGDGGAGACVQPPMPGHWYDVVTWQESVPVVERRYTVRISKSKPLQYEVVNGSLTSSVKFDGDQAVYTFEKKDIPPFKREPQMVSGGDVMCKLILATLNDWHAKARWFHQANEPSFKTDDAVKEKVRELVGEPGGNRMGDEEKIATLNHWVAENVRYVGTSRGAHEGYTTHAATETFRDRGGVCKDKAGLLVAMLREAGFDSYIVMTEAGSHVEQTPADQFNHAVTCIKNKDGSFRLLDPTWLPKNREMWSSAEQRQAVVYGTPQGEAGLQVSAYSPPEESAVTWRAEAALLPNGELRGSIHVTTVGCPETSLRRALAGLKPADRTSRFEESLRRLSPVAVLESLTATDPVDFSGPATLTMNYLATDYSIRTPHQQYFHLPSLTGVLTDLVLPDILESAPTEVKDRKYAVRIRSTRRWDLQETVRLPTGSTTEHVPEAVSLDSPAASMEFKVESTGGELQFRCKVDLKKHVVPVEDYGKYKEVIDKLKDLGKELIVCRQEEQSAQR